MNDTSKDLLLAEHREYWEHIRYLSQMGERIVKYYFVFLASVLGYFLFIIKEYSKIKQNDISSILELIPDINVLFSLLFGFTFILGILTFAHNLNTRKLTVEYMNKLNAIRRALTSEGGMFLRDYLLLPVNMKRRFFTFGYSFFISLLLIITIIMLGLTTIWLLARVNNMSLHYGIYFFLGIVLATILFILHVLYLKKSEKSFLNIVNGSIQRIETRESENDAK